MTMSRLRDFMRYDKEAPGVAVDERLALELRRLATLFLVSALTLVLFVLRALAETASMTFIPSAVYIAWGVILLVGWAATLVYAVYVTWTARRWGWLLLCAIPLTCIPAAVAYAWIRRQEIERTVMLERRDAATRQRRGGRGKRR